MTDDEARDDDVLRDSIAKIQVGDLAGAQAVLFAHLETTDRRPAKLVANLCYALANGPPEPRARAMCDEALALIDRDPSYLRLPALPENLSIVLDHAGRHAEAFALCERAIKSKFFSAGCYVNATSAAVNSGDRALMARAVAMIDKICAKKPRTFAAIPGALDNAAAIHEALGNHAKALEYIALRDSMKL